MKPKFDLAAIYGVGEGWEVLHNQEIWGVPPAQPVARPVVEIQLEKCHAECALRREQTLIEVNKKSNPQASGESTHEMFAEIHSKLSSLDKDVLLAEFMRYLERHGDAAAFLDFVSGTDSAKARQVDAMQAAATKK